MELNASKAVAFAGCRTAASQRRRSAPRLSLLLAMFAAACQGTEPTGTDLAVETPESAEGPDTTAITPDLAPNLLVATALTNQPSGFTTIAEWAATSMPPLSTPTTSGYGIISGKWARWLNSGGTTSASDGLAPKSSSGTLRFKWPKGLAPGTSYGMVTAWTPTSGTEYSKIYESGWVKIPSADFEQHGPSYGMKMFGFWAVARKGASNNQLIGAVYGGRTTITSAFKVQLIQQDIVFRNLWPNVDTRMLFTAGQWHRYEILMEINTIGQANGKFKMWWNGIKTHDYSNVVYRTSTYPAKFFARKWDPTWGGNGGPNKQRDDYLLVDHLYISGVK